MLQDSGFTDVMIGDAVDTFGGAKGEDKARVFEVYGYAFMARRPACTADGGECADSRLHVGQSVTAPATPRTDQG